MGHVKAATAAMTVGVPNTGSVITFEPRPISEVFISQQVAKKKKTRDIPI
jgi:hypothetical protein